MTMFVFGKDFHAIASGAGVLQTAYEDVELRYRDVEATEALSDFLVRMRSEKPHWFAVQHDASGDDPCLYSVDAQGRFARENGEGALASLLASHGMKPGQLKKRAAASSDLPPSTNPYAPGFTGDRHKKIGELIRALGSAKVSALARVHFCKIDGTPLPKKG